MILEDKRIMLEKIRTLGHQKMKAMETQIKKIAEDLSAKLLEKYVLMMKYRMKKKEERKEMKMKIKALKKNIHAEYKEWIKICSKVLTKT